jgi:DNA modification methylase
LYYGDNLPVLREHIRDESIDLVYLDPPFNSDKNYNVLFKKKTGNSDDNPNPQILAFNDTWTWGVDDEALIAEIITSSTPRVSDTVQALYKILGQSDLMSYVVMMAPRLIELRRVLKASGTLYLHCDPSASHYLKILLDAIFGPQLFGNEIIWYYQYGGRSKRHFGEKHDVILRYTKSKSFTFNSDSPAVRIPHLESSIKQNYRYVDEDGRLYRQGTWKSGKRYRYYADEGRLRDDVFTDIPSIHSQDEERLGYPTQKPLQLLRVVIEASSNPGDVVLDPFCGCGTAVVAAQELKREWIGIDITYVAVDLIRRRLQEVFGKDCIFKVHGIPTDRTSAQALFDVKPLDFERWVVTRLQGHPNDKQVGDRGVDGRIRFWHQVDELEDMIVSVKGGRQLNPSMVRDLRGTIERLKKPMGVLVLLHEPTAGMTREANSAGLYKHPPSGLSYPKLQVITVDEIFKGKKLNMPTIESPFRRAANLTIDQDQLEID